MQYITLNNGVQVPQPLMKMRRRQSAQWILNTVRSSTTAVSARPGSSTV